MPSPRHIALALFLSASPMGSQAAEAPNTAQASSKAANPSSLLMLQSGAVRSKATTADGAQIELINLNPSIGRWLLLSLSTGDGSSRWSHLDLGQEGGSQATLTQDGNLRVEPRSGKPVICPLDTPGARAPYAKKYGEPFTSVCSGAIFVRSTPAKGYKSNLESVTDWLREQGPMGETLITWRKDLFPSHGDEAKTGEGAGSAGSSDGPANAAVSKGAPANLSTANLGVKTASRSLATGTWLPVVGAPGVWTSISAPSFSPSIFSDHPASSSLAYFMAIETSTIDPRYSVGVDHPAVGWSTRAPSPHEGGGPDGFGTIAPLQRVGMVPPWAINQLVAVITGGFKREHSAFKGGTLSARNHGSHYGFAEAGVSLSRINPGISTFFQRVGEAPQIKIWSAEDEARGTDKLIFARQNGLPLVENGKPGSNLAIDHAGNWSGNQDGNPNTMRSSLCMATHGSKKYMIYGVFSNAVPKDMAQLLVAYNCKDAMQLDMNAPALSYAAVVAKDDKGVLRYMPLIGSMDDKNFGGTGRFTNTPDTRDFIYFERR
jgi:hypothetical protein